MAKKLVFLDTVEDVNAYLKKHRPARDPDGAVLVAMKPSVRAFAMRMGLRTDDTTPYFMNDSHAKALERSKLLTDWLRGRLELTDPSLGIRRAYDDAIVFWARSAIHYYIWAAETISRAIDSNKPDIVAASLSPVHTVDSLYVMPAEKSLGRMVCDIADIKKVRFEEMRIGADSGVEGARQEDRGRMIGAVNSIKRYVRFRAWACLALLRNRFIKKPVVLFTTPHYQMDRLSVELRKKLRNSRFCLLRSTVVVKQPFLDVMLKISRRRRVKEMAIFKAALGRLSEDIEKEKRLFSHNGVSFATLLASKIRNNIADHIMGLAFWASAVDGFIAAIKPSFIMSNGTRDDDMMIAEICRNRAVKSVLISHGSHTRPKNEFERMEWEEHGRALLRAPYAYLALQTPMAEGYREAFPSASKDIRTGPLIWGRPADWNKARPLFGKMFGGNYDLNGTKIVVHAGTPKPSNALRFHVYETPDEYIKALGELAAAVEAVPDTVLIVKFRPSSEITAEDIKTLVPFSEKIVLSVDERFSDVLGMADLVVSFSSTTIEEALQNRIPVMLYGGVGRYQHVSARDVRRHTVLAPSAIYHVADKDDIGFAVRGILRLHDGLKEEGAGLFDPFIYSKDAIEPISDLLKEGVA